MLLDINNFNNIRDVMCATNITVVAVYCSMCALFPSNYNYIYYESYSVSNALCKYVLHVFT